MEQRKEVGTKDSSLATLHNTVFSLPVSWRSCRFSYPGACHSCVPALFRPFNPVLFLTFSFDFPVFPPPAFPPAVKQDDKR